MEIFFFVCCSMAKEITRRKMAKKDRKKKSSLTWCGVQLFMVARAAFTVIIMIPEKKASLINSAFCCSPLMLVRFHSYKVHTIRTAASSDDATWVYRKYIYGEGAKKTHRRLSEGGEIFLILLIFLIFMWAVSLTLKSSELVCQKLS